MRKRLLAILIAASMLLTFMPCMPFAEAEDSTAAGTAGPEMNAEAYVIGDEQPDQIIDDETGGTGDAEPDVPEIGGTEPDGMPALTEEDADEAAAGGSAAETEAAGQPEEETDDTEDPGTEEGFEEFAADVCMEEDAIEGIDPEQQMEDLFLEGTGAEAGSGRVLSIESVKGERLSGNDLKYYNYYKAIIQGVGAGSRESAATTVSCASYLGKKKFTAKDIGLSSIAYKKNGKWILTDKARKKIEKLLEPEDIHRVYSCLYSDLSSESYWVDWYNKRNIYKYSYGITFNKTSFTLTSNSKISFMLPVMPEFAKSAGVSGSYVYIADTSKIRSALSAKEYARSIVRDFDSVVPTVFAGYSSEYIDLNRLWFYCCVIAQVTSYDYAAAAESDPYRKGPWSLISVFDRDPGTKTVCAGYARAFKLLCDLSSFRSNWIDCQIMTGTVDGAAAGHMWNIVRMNDGLNYLVDPTWMDAEAEYPDQKWFLRGDPYGSADAFSIDGNRRVYDAAAKKAFAPGERLLARKAWYSLGADRAVSISGTKIKKLKKGKKSFTVKWKAVKTPVGALYVDGYQIQYSLKKNFKKAKTITVKGYGKSSYTVKKLKKKKKYYVRIRTYAKVGRNTYYSGWSGKKKVKTR